MSSDSYLVSCAVAVALTAAGFGAFYLAWRGSAASLVVGVQLAYLVSGGLSGVALIVAGIGFLSIQVSRHLAAREDADLDELLDRTLAVLAALKEQTGVAMKTTGGAAKRSGTGRKSSATRTRRANKSKE